MKKGNKDMFDRTCYKFMAKNSQACLWDESLFFSLAFYID